MLRGFATVSFYAADLEAAKVWYADLLGIDPYYVVPGYIEFRVGDFQHELGIIDSRYAPADSPTTPGGAIIFWHVDDLSATLQALLDKGATEYQPITDRGHGFVTAAVVDPFGNVLGIMSNPHYLEGAGRHYQGMTTAQGVLRRIRGHELRVDIRRGAGDGSGTGTPLLLLSGIGIGYEIFDRFAAALEPDGDIIRIDVPGVGGSPAALFPMGFGQLATLLAGLLDDLGYRQIDVLGFSWGGALAQQFAVQYPGRCRRLILMSTSAGLVSVPGEPQVLAKMLSPQDFRDARGAARMMYGVNPDAHIDDVRQLFRNSAATSSGLGYLHQLAAVACWTSLFFLPFIRQPTLVVGGDSDPLVPVANSRILAALIPNATLQVFAGGHIEPLADPAIAAPLISHFLGR